MRALRWLLPIVVVAVACHSEPNPSTAVVTLPTPSSSAVAPVATTPVVIATVAPLAPPANVRDYFPDDKNGGFIDFVRDWYGKVLGRMHEPSLWKASSEAPAIESYRFTWLRTWGRPVSLRFDVDASGAMLRYVELDGQAGYEPGKIAIDKTRHVSGVEWAVVATALKKMSFWSTPPTSNDMGNDGLEWVIEGSSGGKYHVTDRWTPSYETAKRGLVDYQAACRAAFDLAGVSGPFE
jgi:hypothetical protein